jgi:hypothetical protein
VAYAQDAETFTQENKVIPTPIDTIVCEAEEEDVLSSIDYTTPPPKVHIPLPRESTLRYDNSNLWALAVIEPDAGRRSKKVSTSSSFASANAKSQNGKRGKARPVARREDIFMHHARLIKADM